jgi:hypothetical protein
MMLLPGFVIDFTSFVSTAVLFTLIEVFLSPLLTKISIKNMPTLAGGVALVTTFVGLLGTSYLLPGFTIGGIRNLLLSTFIVWLGALLAGVFLPMFMFKKYLENRKS